MPLQPGDCVEVFGLESEKGKALNGNRGILTKHFEAKGRFEVRVTPDRSVNMKPENLRKVELTVAERLRILGLGGSNENRSRNQNRLPGPGLDHAIETPQPVVQMTNQKCADQS